MNVNSSRTEASGARKHPKRPRTLRTRRSKAPKARVTDTKLSDSIVSKKRTVRRRKKRTASQILGDESSREPRKLSLRASPILTGFGPEPTKPSAAKTGRSSKMSSDKCYSATKKTKNRNHSITTANRYFKDASKDLANTASKQSAIMAALEQVGDKERSLERAPPSVVKKMVASSQPRARMHVNNFIRDLRLLQAERDKALRSAAAARRRTAAV